MFCLIFPHISFYLLNFAEAFFPKHNSLFCSEHGPLIEFLITFRSQSRICQVMKCLTWSNTVNYICCQEGQKSCSILLHSRLLLGWKVFHNDLTATWQIFFFFWKFQHIGLVREIRFKMGKKNQKGKRWPRMEKIGIENNKKIEQSWYSFPKLTHRNSMWLTHTNHTHLQFLYALWQSVITWNICLEKSSWWPIYIINSVD